MVGVRRFAAHEGFRRFRIWVPDRSVCTCLHGALPGEKVLNLSGTIILWKIRPSTPARPNTGVTPTLGVGTPFDPPPSAAKGIRRTLFRDPRAALL